MRYFVVLILVLFPLCALAQVRVDSSAAQRQDIIFAGKNEANVARAFAIAPRPTSDCIQSMAAGAQGELFGLTFSGNSQSKPCNIRAYSEALRNMGREHLAFYVLMQDPIVKNAYEEMAKDLGVMVKEDAEVIDCEYPTPECKRLKKQR